MNAELRRAPRAAHPGDAKVRLGSRLAVRIVNISLTGVLLETSDGAADVRRGDHLELMVPLRGNGFTARLEVGREHRLSDGRNGGRLRVGCAFVDLNDSRRQQLAAFLADGVMPSRASNGG